MCGALGVTESPTCTPGRLGFRITTDKPWSTSVTARATSRPWPSRATSTEKHASELPGMSMEQIQQLCENEVPSKRAYFRHFVDVAEADYSTTSPPPGFPASTAAGG